MGKLIFSMSVSLDGFIAGPGGEIDWSPPDEELHRFHNERVRELGMHLCGRGLYEAMLYWETAEEDPAAGEVAHEFARIWKPLPKLVFSRTLSDVQGNWRLVRDVDADEIARLKAEVDGDIGVGGAGLAATLMRLGLVDEYQLFVNPVVLGGGTPFFPPLDERIGLELIETRTFGSRVVYAGYRSSTTDSST
jgi:dihydrofolate reductase